MRYFRATFAAYEQFRLSLNAAWGFPAPGTDTSLPTPDDCLRDDAGLVYVSVDAWMCELSPVPQILGEALAAGAAQEISEAEMVAASLRYQPMP